MKYINSSTLRAVFAFSITLSLGCREETKVEPLRPKAIYTPLISIVEPIPGEIGSYITISGYNFEQSNLLVWVSFRYTYHDGEMGYMSMTLPTEIISDTVAKSKLVPSKGGLLRPQEVDLFMTIDKIQSDSFPLLLTGESICGGIAPCF